VNRGNTFPLEVDCSTDAAHFLTDLQKVREYIEAQVEHAKEDAILSKLRTQLASQQSYSSG
jgi:hypothetical protein